MQEFLGFFVWDHGRVNDMLQYASAHAKQGDKTPGVKRQWCGESGKRDNCIVGQHLLYTDNHASNPFNCVPASDLYLPESWDEDRDRCREAGIPDDVVYRPKWRIAIDEIERAIGNGVLFAWQTFDEDYGSVPAFWFELDRLGQRGVGEVRSNFHVWPTRPHSRSGQKAHAAKRVDHVCRHSPAFTWKKWHRIKIKDTTRGPAIWEAP